MRSKDAPKNNMNSNTLKPKKQQITFADNSQPCGDTINNADAQKKNSGQKKLVKVAANLTQPKPDWYEELSEDQVRMFKEMFDLLDADGGGSIDAKELYSCMNNLDIDVTLEEIVDVLTHLDQDGNGEIDFDEFLYSMAEADKYMDMLAEGTAEEEDEKGYTKRQTLFFTAITKFAIKHSLGDIERYYVAKARKVPHVISHYTAGARLIGLNDKQLEQCLRRMQKQAKNQDSPYAKPLQFVTPSTKKKPATKKFSQERLDTTDFNMTTDATSIMSVPNFASMPFSGRRRTAILKSTSEHRDILVSLRDLAEKGSVLAKLPNVHLLPQIRTKLESGAVDDIPICSSIRKRRRALEANGDGPHSTALAGRPSTAPASCKRESSSARHGWTMPRINHIKVPLPKITLSHDDIVKGLTVEDVPKIRKKVTYALDEYYSTLRKAHVKRAWAHWDSLHTDEIPSDKLLNNFKRVYRAYSPHKEGEVYVIRPWIPGPKYACRRNHDSGSKSPTNTQRPNSSLT